MKKILAIVLSAAALLLTLAGCGPKTASAGNASGGNAYYASAGNYYASYASCRRCFWTPTKSSCRSINCSNASRRRAAMPPLCKGRWILPQAKDGGIVAF